MRTSIRNIAASVMAMASLAAVSAGTSMAPAMELKRQNYPSTGRVGGVKSKPYRQTVKSHQRSVIKSANRARHRAHVRAKARGR